jgi:hypothetical protein
MSFHTECRIGLAGIGERRGAYRVLVCKSEEKGKLGKPRSKWEDNIIMNL